VVAGDHEQPGKRDIERRARLLQERERPRVVGGVAPVAEIAGEHDQIEPHAVLAELKGGRADAAFIEDLVEDGLADTLLGRLSWDPEQRSLRLHVRSAIHSRMWHDRQRAGRRPHFSLEVLNATLATDLENALAAATPASNAEDALMTAQVVARLRELTCAEVAKLKISRRPVSHGEVIALPAAAGAEGAEPADSDASRYTARYSPRNDEESHAKISPIRGAQARGPLRRAEPRRGGTPAPWRAKRVQGAWAHRPFKHDLRRGRDRQPRSEAENARGRAEVQRVRRGTPSQAPCVLAQAPEPTF